MTPAEIKAACMALGLTQGQLASMLDLKGARGLRSLLAEPGAKTHREPAPRVVRLIKAYLGGYRPDDWPAPAEGPRRGRKATVRLPG